MSYTAQWRTAVVVALILVAIGAIHTAGPVVLGIQPVVLQWLGVLAAVLTVAQAMLPKVQAIPEPDYDAKRAADHIEAMTPAQRADLLAELERRNLGASHA